MLLANSLITDAIQPQRPKHCETRVLASARPARPQSQRSLKSLRGLRVAICLSASALVLVASPYRVAQDGLSLTLSPQAAWAQGNSGRSDSGNSGNGNGNSGNGNSGNSDSGDSDSGNSGNTGSPGNSGNAGNTGNPGNATDPGNAADPQDTDPNGDADEDQSKALNVTPPTNPVTALNPGNKPKTYINATTGDRIEVRGASVGVVHSNGLSERIDGGHYEMRDAMGRTIIRRQAKNSDRARLLRMIE